MAVLHRHGFNREAVALRENFGGTNFYVPKRPSQTDRYVSVIGMDAAQVLADELGGITVAIAQENTSRIVILRDRVRLFSLAGIPVRVTAVVLGVTERCILRHRVILRNAGVRFPKVTNSNPFTNSARKVQ
ncbi:hypothetical protein [Blastomonas fulva]|uniref:hypothetical protein n=1 Tax=Blastomonas fulva TaxID=1550728 RepID=UPI004033B6BB